MLLNEQMARHGRNVRVFYVKLGLHGEVAQWLRRLTADSKVSSSSPALPTMPRVRDISNLCSHTVHSAECTGNCA